MRSLKAAICALALSWAGLALAGEMSVKIWPYPPTENPGPGTWILIRAQGAEGRELAWHWGPSIAEGEILDVGELLEGSPGPVKAFCSRTPGPRDFQLQVAAAGLDPLIQCRFDYGAPGPDPDPTAFWGLICVYETGERSDKIEALLDHAEEILEARGRHCERIDQHKTDQTGRRLAWAEKADGKTLPFGFLINRDGKILDSRALPATAEAVDKWLSPYLPPAMPPPALDDVLRSLQAPGAARKPCPTGGCPAG